MRIFVCVQREFGRDVVRALHEAGHDIVGVAPPPQNRLKDKVTGYAMLKGIPIFSDCDALTSDDVPDGTDLVVTAFSHWMVSDAILEKATHGGIGFHPSLLPRHRGRDAIRWAHAMGDAVTGGTVYWLCDRCDGGDILMQRHVLVDRARGYRDIWRDLYPIGIDMLVESVGMIEGGCAPRVPQDERFATWEPAYRSTRLKRNELLKIE